MFDNDDFVGHELDEEKLARLNTMKALCKMVTEEEEQITQPFFPFDNRRRHAGVQLVLPCVIFMENRKPISALSALFGAADDVTIAVADDGHVRLTFSVRDIWKN